MTFMFNFNDWKHLKHLTKRAWYKLKDFQSMSEKTCTKQTLKKYNPLLIIVYRQLNKNGCWFQNYKVKKKSNVKTNTLLLLEGIDTKLMYYEESEIPE